MQHLSLDLFLSPSFLVCLLAASVCVPVCEKQLHANTQAHIHTHRLIKKKITLAHTHTHSTYLPPSVFVRIVDAC